MMPNRTRQRFLAALLVGAFLFCCAQEGRAEFIGSAVNIQIWNSTDSGNFELDLAIPSDPWSWELAAPVQIYGKNDPGNLMATIDSLSVGLNGDPAVSLSFAVTAGSAATVISVSSSTVLFSPIANADAFATAAISLTDGNGNGASLIGGFSGKSYEAQYNGGTIYTDLVSGFSAGADASSINSERTPTTGTATIPGTISSIQSQFGFLLSAHDSASGTSRFQVTSTNNIPEPSTWALACLALIGWTWLRRHNTLR